MFIWSNNIQTFINSVGKEVNRCLIMHDRETGERIPLIDWLKKYHSEYTECKSQDCHKVFSMLGVVDETSEGYSDNLCVTCRVEIESFLISAGHDKDMLQNELEKGTVSQKKFEEEVDTSFEMARTVIRRKGLDYSDVPEWIETCIEERLPAREQTVERYGEEI